MTKSSLDEEEERRRKNRGKSKFIPLIFANVTENDLLSKITFSLLFFFISN
jgi:hypothetical protein